MMHQIFKSTVLLLSILIIGCQESDDNKWRNYNSTDKLVKEYPGRIKSLFSELNPDYPGLEQVNANLESGDTLSAATALVSYFRNVDRDWVVTTLDPIDEEHAEIMSNLLLSDSISIHGSKVKMPYVNGGWKWNYTGPIKDDEFGYSLNGHSYLTSLYATWKNTNDNNLIKTFDQIVKDWVIHHPLPEEGDSVYVVLDPNQRIDYRDIGEVEWRTLEGGRRLGATWPQMFYAFHKEESFSDAGILLMLTSIADQANFLRQYHKSGHNWTTMEMNGLALVGLSFPEFSKAEDWSSYALNVMSNEINRQVYPDGLQTELSTKTQWVALRRFESVANNFTKANKEISQAYLDRIEDMYNYLAYCMRPDGHQPINSDSDREDLRERVLIAAKKFNRPDWEWVATNGASGQKPDQSPSLTFPWAGIHITRNGWDANAHWSFFDFGAYGTGHQHRDKLHLSVAAFGKDLLVDGGRYTHENYFSFDPKIWRGYFRSSFSHNVILVNGKGQDEGPTMAAAPLEEGIDFIHTDLYDYAYGTFNDGFEGVDTKVVHSRSVLYVHDQFWVVMDNLETDQPIDIQALWHFTPGRKISFKDEVAFSDNPGEPNLKIVPLGDVSWQTDVVEGQEEPFIQGWYSRDYTIKEPNPAVIYASKLEKSQSFLWVLVPSKDVSPDIQTRHQQKSGLHTISVSVDGKTTHITLPVKKDISKVKVSQ